MADSPLDEFTLEQTVMRAAVTALKLDALFVQLVKRDPELAEGTHALLLRIREGRIRDDLEHAFLDQAIEEVDFLRPSPLVD
ncbi:hypothetical protein F1643_13330 [Azospirillum sp. INR13]|uniref:hypothetical protein n=1 Tax=Azospirillum sp. INR13 TaxID=2596919 RepID=UPI00189214DF|nr:hypothetical protein [Azospirillum sp. INR13]MBF5095299.1 hypothetical protein [Azospirillum sp. INR13]